MAEYGVAGVEFESPLVNAAGSINDTSEERILHEVGLLADTGIGAITVGSFTIPRQDGNEAKFGSPTLIIDKDSGRTYNSMGLPNIGIEAAKTLLPKVIERAHDKGKPVIASVSSTLHSDEIGGSLAQLTRLVGDALETGVDLVEVNTSCQNTVTADGGRKPIIGYDLETMAGLVDALEPFTRNQDSKVGVKLPPYLTLEEMDVASSLSKIFIARRVFGFITLPNTIGGQIPVDSEGNPRLSVPTGMGGMSGPATKHIGRMQLVLWEGLVGDDIDIISTLGVDSGKELMKRMELGAAAAGGVTFLWQSSNWKRAVTDMLTEFVG